MARITREKNGRILAMSPKMSISEIAIELLMQRAINPDPAVNFQIWNFKDNGAWAVCLGNVPGKHDDPVIATMTDDEIDELPPLGDLDNYGIDYEREAY